MGTFILWMTLFSHDSGKYLVQERFSSMDSCENFVQEWRHSGGEKPIYKAHFCYEDK